MEKAIHTTAPYFDPMELREELAAVSLAAGTASNARKIIVDRLKSLVAEARNAARAGLEADHNGRRCAAGLSQFQDELVRLLYDHSVKFVYRTTNPSDAERMAMVATAATGAGFSRLIPTSICCFCSHISRPRGGRALLNTFCMCCGTLVSR